MPEKKQITQTYDLSSFVHCPKCQGSMIANTKDYVMRSPEFFNTASNSAHCIKKTTEPVFECTECGAFFALATVITRQLCELVPDTWAKHPQEA